MMLRRKSAAGEAKRCEMRTTIFCSLLISAWSMAAADGPLFPEAFLVEHQIVQTLPDGDVFANEPVTDYYGGSFIVSLRTDGSRLIVDLSDRKMTEIRPERGTYSVISFDRFGELSRRLQMADGPTPGKSSEESGADPNAGADEVKFSFTAREVQPLQGQREKSARFGLDDSLIARSGVRRLEISATPLDSTKSVAAMDFWFDPEIKLTARAQEAFVSFEQAVSGRRNPGSLSFSDLTAQARKSSNGALPFRTSRAMVMGVDADEAGSVDDIALRVEILLAFPTELLEIPEGLKRAPHPLELMVNYAEEEAELRSKMSVKQ